ncbi:hypothetical protein [Anabaena azotica]|uniref:Uncharacterized protein n=1 Tax=Anabaena azotica FACHB-119 TaxID=947527 RepID=A0ABR8D6X5_9NOST|nr:hypothetical protein [Anabaena azotica]MBD2502875.1 hypothetical protein [Anabaena azotica FACHB-119]
MSVKGFVCIDAVSNRPEFYDLLGECNSQLHKQSPPSRTNEKSKVGNPRRRVLSV